MVKFGSALTVAALLLCGCAGSNTKPMGTVSGKVTVGGEPPQEKMMVFFLNTKVGQGSNGATEPDGSYKLFAPLPLLEYTVYFARIPESVGPVGTDQEVLKSIPREYGNEETSPLTYTLVEGHNDIPLELPTAR